MQIVKLIELLADRLVRQACGAFIERCHALAGQFACGDVVSAAFFNSHSRGMPESDPAAQLTRKQPLS